MSRPTPPTCKTRNWPAYIEALKRHGSLTIWFDPAMNREAAPAGTIVDPPRIVRIPFTLDLPNASKCERGAVVRLAVKC